MGVGGDGDPSKAAGRPSEARSGVLKDVLSRLVGRQAPDQEPAPRLELYSSHRIRDNPELVQRVRRSVVEHRFSKLSGWSDGGEARYAKAIDQHAFGRHDHTIEYIVPWVNQSVPLAGKSVVEIGCGTGSSTAAFAEFTGQIRGYDISQNSINGARSRLDAHGLSKKATVTCVEPEALWPTIRADHDGGQCDIVLLFALLEHQTLEERLETLRLSQEIVRPGGVIVICETPNRLTYVDHHTSQLPFFHMLPIELQMKVAKDSPRFDFRDNVERFVKKGAKPRRMRELLSRWGQSVSFHEFDLTFNDVDSRILSCGTHPNLLTLRPPTPEEAALASFMQAAGLKRHEGFMRYYLDLIIRVG